MPGGTGSVGFKICYRIKPTGDGRFGHGDRQLPNNITTIATLMKICSNGDYRVARHEQGEIKLHGPWNQRKRES
jgi:hypothetical protein